MQNPSPDLDCEAELRQWCVQQVMHSRISENGVKEIIRCADTLYDFIVNGKKEAREGSE